MNSMNIQHAISSKLIKLNNYKSITLEVEELYKPENIEVVVEEQFKNRTLKISFKSLDGSNINEYKEYEEKVCSLALEYLKSELDYHTFTEKMNETKNDFNFKKEQS